ncbi:hypothetical protein INS49_010816 [Diaporthe citri]|uniref:uncharacterized protein n=1 Tax=Diaporthe citri TaxID=83186 RepID=UPI001C819462|nr:uncharacterized protein INS49_010816 [Diaporthe citri]KAG6359764.1 hypothetical protein INS49_010816 [Diaporthe citri]
MDIMGAGYSPPCDDEYRTQDKQDPVLANCQTRNEATPLPENGGLETMTTRLCPYGYEIVEDPLAAPHAGSTKPPLDETLIDLTRQLEMQGTVEILDWKQHAAKQEKFLIALLTWALNMIDAAQCLQGNLRGVLVRFAKAQDQVVALQRDQEEAAGMRASLEMRLNNAGLRLKTAEDRSLVLEKENQQMSKVFASIKRRLKHKQETNASPKTIGSIPSSNEVSRNGGFRWVPFPDCEVYIEFIGKSPH